MESLFHTEKLRVSILKRTNGYAKHLGHVLKKNNLKKQTHKQEHCLPNYKSWTKLKHNPTNLKQDKAILRSLSTLSYPILPIYRYLCYIMP
jgi:hypothetical protein